MSEIKELRKRVELLEQCKDALFESDTDNLANSQLEKAKFMALYSIVQELSERAGISQQEFLEHFGKRFRWWHQHYLETVEAASPSLAAEIDTRAIYDSASGDSYPPLFH